MALDENNEILKALQSVKNGNYFCYQCLNSYINVINSKVVINSKNKENENNNNKLS